jgi:histone H3/H4
MKDIIVRGRPRLNPERPQTNTERIRKYRDRLSKLTPIERIARDVNFGVSDNDRWVIDGIYTPAEKEMAEQIQAHLASVRELTTELNAMLVERINQDVAQGGQSPEALSFLEKSLEELETSTRLELKCY